MQHQQFFNKILWLALALLAMPLCASTEEKAKTLQIQLQYNNHPVTIFINEDKTVKDLKAAIRNKIKNDKMRVTLIDGIQVRKNRVLLSQIAITPSQVKVFLRDKITNANQLVNLTIAQAEKVDVISDLSSKKDKLAAVESNPPRQSPFFDLIIDTGNAIEKNQNVTSLQAEKVDVISDLSSKKDKLAAVESNPSRSSLFSGFTTDTEQAIKKNQNITSLQAKKIYFLSRGKRKLLVTGYCRVYNININQSIYLCLLLYIPLEHKNKPLPYDLSGQNLSDYDFTGCKFTYTNLTRTRLTNVILINTTCDYVNAFQQNVKKSPLFQFKYDEEEEKKYRIQASEMYKGKLDMDLQRISEVYPKLKNDTHKAQLLQIACAISLLPSCLTKDQFHVKVAYWSYQLLQVKQLLGEPYTDECLGSFHFDLEDDCSIYCWTTKYPQDKIDIEKNASDTNFDLYLKEFDNGLAQYQCESKNKLGFFWYKNQITKNIKGLKNAYPYIKNLQLQQEARNIAHALSKSYQFQQGDLLEHYLFYQNRLISLRKSVNLGAKPDIYYQYRNLNYSFDYLFL